METKYIISTNDTAFAIDFLYEVSLHCLHSNASIQGLSDIYNQLHNFKESNLYRQNLNRQRLADGFFLYGLLEISERSGIQPLFNKKKDWLDDGLLSNHYLIKKSFSNTWTGDHD